MSAKVVLRGSLSFISLGDLIQQLGGNGSNGVIQLTSPYADATGRIYMKDGNPINADYGDLNGIEALNAFFGWKNAEFEFLDEAVTCERIIKKSRMEIILDGLRMVDDGLIKHLGPKDEKTGMQPVAPDGKIPVIKGSIIDYVYVVDEEEFADGMEIVQQNRFGNWFWVILSGAVDIIRIMPEGKVPIVRLSEGAFIGSIVSFLREGNIRSATVEAVGDVQLGVLDSELIAHEYSNLSDDMQNMLISMDKRLKQVTDVCANALLNHNIIQNQPIKMAPYISQEKNEDKVFRIVEGRSDIIRKTKNGYVHLCTMTAGDFIGQIPFLNTSHEPYSAIAYISDDFDGDAFDMMDVEQEYRNLSNTFKNMIQNTATAISITTGRILDLLKFASENK